MAKDIVFNGPENLAFNASIIKVDRKKLYGYSVVNVKDQDGLKCSLATLSDNGTHILPSGCTGITKFDSDNNYIHSSSVQVLDLDGNMAEKVPSVFDEEVSLQPVTAIEDYLDLNVKSIYQLEIAAELKPPLIDYLKKNHLLSFVFNYRADYEGDDAFLITDDNEIFVVVGTKCLFEYQSLEVLNEDLDDDDNEDDDFDFGML